MLSDAELEAPPQRRLLAFAATFLGMLTLAQATFASGTPTLSPPIVMLVVLMSASAGLLIWIRGRWSRALFWLSAGLLLLLAGMTAFLQSTVAWLGMLLVLLGLAGLLAGIVLAVGLFRPASPVIAWQKPATYTMLVAAILLGILVAPAGRGPLVAVIGASVAMLLVWLLRPVDEA